MAILMRAAGPGFRPVLICDHCGVVIEDVTYGNVLWSMSQDEDLGQGRLYFVCNPCTNDFKNVYLWLDWEEYPLGYFVDDLPRILRYPLLGPVRMV